MQYKYGKRQFILNTIITLTGVVISEKSAKSKDILHDRYNDHFTWHTMHTQKNSTVYSSAICIVPFQISRSKLTIRLKMKSNQISKTHTRICIMLMAVGRSRLTKLQQEYGHFLYLAYSLFFFYTCYLQRLSSLHAANWLLHSAATENGMNMFYF